MTDGLRIRVRGLVQGVGFRPTVWRIANRLGLSGEVLNDSEGVLIQAFGSTAALAALEFALMEEAPPLARVDAIEAAPLEGEAPADFRIVASRAGDVRTGVVPDAATCPDCLADIRDPQNRRYRYPFTNCTHCGPRLSIVRAIPYDRATTSMAAFAMCPACLAEYRDPSDRRFHAQPNACPACGPRCWLEDAAGRAIPNEPHRDAIQAAGALILSGAIAAIKGIGGFHLACDAGNAEAVARLRERKVRTHKPFALMARDVAMIADHARISEQEAALLVHPAAPIVLLDACLPLNQRRPPSPQPSPAKGEGAGRARCNSVTSPLAGEGQGEGVEVPELCLALGVAPAQSTLGFMLPYTPLHHLLLDAVARPIVLTSGNRSDEPQCIANDEARARLGAIADAFLMHDRDIVNRLDDSVARVMAGRLRIMRRARGFAPSPLTLPEGFEAAPRVLAMGAELKSTFCLLRDGRAIVSQHIGDLEDAATHADYRANLKLYREIFQFEPELVAVDAHPDYHSTAWGKALADECALPLENVLHHHAHVAAVLAEHGAPLGCEPVLGIALDGLGLGENGELWGGEFLLADYRSCRRVAAFAPAPLIGGDRAMREPWRNALAHLATFLGWESVERRHASLDLVRRLKEKPLALALQLMDRGLNAPPSSSAGRLFDAVAAAVGICFDATSYEGQAAIELEALAAPAMARAGDGYRGAFTKADVCEIDRGSPPSPCPSPARGEGMKRQSAQPAPSPHAGEGRGGGVRRRYAEHGVARLDWAPLWRDLLEDLAHGADAPLIAAKFHAGLAATLAEAAARLAERHGCKTAVLCGGVFQNKLLLEGVLGRLADAGLDVLSPEKFPAGDGAIALGQAIIAAASRLHDPTASRGALQ
jgi:hydrogenase maturation protein HypF